MSKTLKEIKINHSTYIIQAELDNEDLYVNFKVFAVVGECYSEMGVEYDPPKKEFIRRGSTSSMDTTFDLEEARRMLSGTVKFDGCSDLIFFPDESGYEHFCGRKSASNIGQVIDAVYSLAVVMLGSNADGDLS